MGFERTAWKFFPLLAALSGWVPAAPAARGEDELSRFLADLERTPPLLFRPDLVRPEMQEALSARHPGYLRFLAEHPGRWMVVWNEASGTPHRLSGDSFALRLPGGAVPEGREQLEEAARGFIARHADLLGARADDLVLEASRDLGTFHVLRFGQRHRGIEVLGARVELRVAPGGRALGFGSDLVPAAVLDALPVLPGIGSAAAESSARAHAAGKGRSLPRGKGRLAVLPAHAGRRLLARLVWEVRQEGGESPERWTYLIAAADDGGGEAAAPRARGGRPPGREPRGARAGDLLGSWDRVARGTVSGTVRGKASPGLFPDAPWNPPEPFPLSGLQVEAGARTAVTGADGSFAIEYPGASPVKVTASLRGPYCVVENGAGSELSFSQTVSSGTELAIDFNPAPTEFTTAQVNAFREVNRMHDFVKLLDPGFTAIDRPVLARVNASDSCNAFFIPDGNGILVFFRADPCVNSAYSTVVFHEYAHLVVWKAFGAVIPMPGYNEGVADTFSAYFTDQPVIGHAFGGVQGGAPIRDLSRSTFRYPSDLILEPHISGLILGGALWNLRGRLGAKLGPAGGLDHARSLLFRSLFLAPPMLSPEVTQDFLELDDDNQRLADGTPRFAEIAEAFTRHGLPPPGQLTIAHTRLADSAAPGPFTVRARVDSVFDFIVPTRVTLHHSNDGGFNYTELPMAPVGGGEYEAAIPAQVPATTVRYYLSAEGTGGARALFPAEAPVEETVAFAVGEVATVFLDGFDGGETGWTHGLIANGNAGNRDDWERGAPRTGVPDPEDNIDGNLIDPPAAFSPPNCYGNDLGLSGTSDRNYSDGSRNFLLSPAIDCRGKFGVHLRFRRWLTAERFDRARILVNDVPVYLSPGNRDVLDTSWRVQDYDIGSLADDRDGVRIRWELASNTDGTAGGWTIDDVRVVATGAPQVARPALTAVEPAFDFKAGGAGFTLRGSGFTTAADTRLKFGSSPVAAFEVAGAETITGLIPPAAAAGPAAISIENSGGAAALPGAFTYFDLPTLELVIPPRASLAGGDAISVSGDYYTLGSELLIGGKSAGPLVLAGNEVLTGAVPPGDDLGPVEVVIRSRFGESRFPGAFTYVEPPVLKSVQPVSGPVAGGIEFRLRGEYFPDETAGITVEFAGRRADRLQTLSRSEITGTVPAADGPGKVEVKITTPGGAASLSAGFEYMDGLPPTFIRGDVNLDRKGEITDAINILGTLFLGEPPLPCEDAADVNDDGGLDISDPVGLLAHLFTGGRAPAPPYPDPGSDPPGDELGCALGLGAAGGGR